MASIVIRLGGRSDAAVATRIEQAAFVDRSWSADGIGDSLASENVELLLAHIEQFGPDPAGFLLSRVCAGEAELLTIGVSPDAQRRGVARALMARFEERAKNDALERLMLEVSSENKPAYGLYEELQFEPIARRKRYYRDRSDAIVMQKLLIRS